MEAAPTTTTDATAVTTTTTTTQSTVVQLVQTSTTTSITPGTPEDQREMAMLLINARLQLMRNSYQDQEQGNAASSSCRRRRTNNNNNHSRSCSPAPPHPHLDNRDTVDVTAGIMDERVLSLVFRSINWDPQALSRAACVSRRIRAVARRVLWRELCYARAPNIVTNLLTTTTPTTTTAAATTTTGTSPTAGTVPGGWPALAKIFLYCCGSCSSTRHLPLPTPSPGHLVTASRFSKTSGQSFLPKCCRGDLLYVSDPCEHPTITTTTTIHASSSAATYDVGVYRGIFCGFIRSRTRAVLVDKSAQLEPTIRCPYCGARVWSMMEANMVPRSAARRLGSQPGCLDYFVCVHGHLHGNCLLPHLSSSSESDSDHDSV